MVRKAVDGGARLEAASELFDLAASDIEGGGGGGGGNFLHRVSARRLPGDGYEARELTLAHRLTRGASKLDRRRCSEESADGSKTKPQHQHGRRPRSASFLAPSKQQRGHSRWQDRHRHVRSLLLRRDAESGYTPLHAALYHGRISLALLLLRRTAEAEEAVSEGQTKRVHPLGLLDGTQSAMASVAAASAVGSPKVGGSQQQHRSLLSELVRARDNEGLTPLEALCRSLSADLGRCRRGLELRARPFGDSGRKKLIRRGESSLLADEDRRRRRRAGRSTRSGSATVADEDGNQLERAEDTDSDRGDTSDDDDLVGRNEFGALYGRGADETQAASSEERYFSYCDRRDYGCEVLTFGRSDHCALGVPRFTSRRDRAESDAGANEARGGGMAVVDSVRPRRVEAFALGEMGRKFGAGDEDDSSHRVGDDECGPAVAVAAAAHHTLVATTNGHLFAFGLGKSGRLGTGDDGNRPIPTRVLGALARRRVVSVAAAVNHSLAVTDDGVLYAFGSNRFGQLGVSSSSTGQVGKKSAGPSDDRCLPRRIDGLRSAFVVAAAAGDRHSVALTKKGEIYAWGDNRAGQLGTMTLSSAASTSGAGGGSGCGHHQPRRVDALWSASPRRVARSVAASEQSTLVLTLPPRMESMKAVALLLPINAVYDWGHGRHPTRVNFPAPGADDDGKRGEIRQQQFRRYVNPVAIASAKYHNAAVTSDGQCFTWGMHSDPLGTSSSSSSAANVVDRADSGVSSASRDSWDATGDASVSTAVGAKKSAPVPSPSKGAAIALASPQLVKGMLPEMGGGFAIAVSASESRTAVVTSAGHLYTWGSDVRKDVLGHQGVRYQPTPRRVPGVHRAVAVATAREHTALLIGTSFPPLPRLICDPRANTLGKEAEIDKGATVEENLVTATAEAEAESDVSPATVSSEITAGKVAVASGKIQEETKATLQGLATRAVARHVDLFNVVPVLIMAGRIGCRPLVAYCETFVKENLDGVLASSKKADLEAHLDESLAAGGHRESEETRDDYLHPFLFRLADIAPTSADAFGLSTPDWLESYHDLLHTLPPALLSRKRTDTLHGSDVDGRYSAKFDPTQPQRNRFSELGCSEKCYALTNNINSVHKHDAIKERLEAISKEVRSVKKKLTQISELEKDISSEREEQEENIDTLRQQEEKLARRPVLKADLDKLQPALEALEDRLRALKLSEEKTKLLELPAEAPRAIKNDAELSQDKKSSSKGNLPSANGDKEKVVSRHRCQTCQIACPDESSYELHINGKKHRNRVRVVEEEEKSRAVVMMEEWKRQQGLQPDHSLMFTRTPSKKSAAEDEIQPRYKLPCPDFPIAAASLPSTPSSQSKPTPSWNSPINHVTPVRVGKKKASATDFKKILEEQERRTAATSRRGKPTGRLAPQPKSPWPSPVTRAPANASTSIGKETIAGDTPVSKTKVSLSAFLGSPSPTKGKIKSAAPVWGQKPAADSRPGDARLNKSTPTSKKGFDEIQREELQFKKKEDQVCSMEGTMWYVTQRERAASVGAIQKQQEEQDQMRLVIQEQKQIEEQIALDLKNKKAKEKKAPGKQQHRKRRPRKQSAKKAEGEASVRTKKSGEDKKTKPRRPI